MLSSFVYSKFKEMLVAKSSLEVIEVIQVNPFATSMMGQINYMKRYRLSSHGSAAVMIARRGLKLKEKRPITDLVKLKVQPRHVSLWKVWSIVNKAINRMYTFKEKIWILNKTS